MAAEDLPRRDDLPDQKDITEEHSFDELARGLASGTVSRRRALKLVGLAIGGGLLSSIPGLAWGQPGPPEGKVPPQAQGPPAGEQGCPEGQARVQGECQPVCITLTGSQCCECVVPTPEGGEQSVCVDRAAFLQEHGGGSIDCQELCTIEHGETARCVRCFGGSPLTAFRSICSPSGACETVPCANVS
jgi:hypothetical protein